MKKILSFTMLAMMLLDCVAYQLQIVTHYPEWQTDYLNAPIISEL